MATKKERSEAEKSESTQKARDTREWKKLTKKIRAEDAAAKYIQDLDF